MSEQREYEFVDSVDEYIYLGQVIKLEKEYQTAEMNWRIRLTWAALGKLQHILKNTDIPILLKRKYVRSTSGNLHIEDNNTRQKLLTT